MDEPAVAPSAPACAPYVSDEARLRALGPASPGWLFEPTEFAPLCTPGEDDWLGRHPEPGQPVEAFRVGPRRLVQGPLVLAPIAGHPVAPALVELVEATLAVPVEVRELAVPLAGLPGRIHPDTGEPQVYTPELLARLEAARPPEAFAILGVTRVDLAPDEEWNFVFGHATYTDGVGVFSTARQLPATPEVLALRRALRTLTHEALHMMGVHHCPYFACLMNGSNSLAESDRSPLHLCPVCLRKLELATGADLVARYERLAVLYRRHGLTQDAVQVEARLRRRPR